MTLRATVAVVLALAVALDASGADSQAAVEAAERAVAAAPESAEAHWRLGNALATRINEVSMFSKPGMAKRIHAAYETAVRLDPAFVKARESLMEFYLQAPAVAGGSVDKAREQADAIARLDAVSGHMALARVQVTTDDLAGARASYEKAVAADPKRYAAWYQIGRIALVTGKDMEGGVAALTRYLVEGYQPKRDEPSLAWAHLRRGQLLQKLGKKAEARADFEKAIALDAALEEARQALKSPG